jgi:hypothetical protein
MKDSTGRFSKTTTAYIVDCLCPNACKTHGKYRMRWMHNVLSVGDVETMISHARHFTEVKAWRVSARYIYPAGAISGHSLPVSKIENTIIAAALLAASNEPKS